MTSKLISSTLLRQYLTKSTRRHPFSTSTAPAAATTDHKPRYEVVAGGIYPWYIAQYFKPYCPHTCVLVEDWEPVAVEDARYHVARRLIGASPKDIVFTSGATESNNISIKGFMQHFYNKEKKKKHVITITTQTQTHTEQNKCVLDCCRQLEQEGFDVTYLPVAEKDGFVDLEKLRGAIRSDTGLVSVNMVVENINKFYYEIQPMEEIGKICKEFNVPFHADAAQASLRKVPIDVNKWNVSLMSLSGHKKGIGALYMRTMIRVEMMTVDGQVDMPFAVGMGMACESAIMDMEFDEEWRKALYQLGYYNGYGG